MMSHQRTVKLVAITLPLHVSQTQKDLRIGLMSLDQVLIQKGKLLIHSFDQKNLLSVMELMSLTLYTSILYIPIS